MKNMKLLRKDLLMAIPLAVGWLMVGISLVLGVILLFNNGLTPKVIGHLAVNVILCWGLWVVTSAGIDSIEESEQLKLEEKRLRR